MSKRILIAPNSFKGSLSSFEASALIKKTLDSLGFNINATIAPVADGGDGTIEVLKYYLKNSKIMECKVHDPLFRIINSCWLMIDENTAVIEVAKSSGIALLKNDELSPFESSSYGTGELILNALDSNCKNIILALGGSATIDCGLGIIEALGGTFYNKKGDKLLAKKWILEEVSGIDLKAVDSRIYDCKIRVLCDVENKLLGDDGAIIFAPQKGVQEKEINTVQKGFQNISKIISANTLNKLSGLEPMTGSAGGISFCIGALFNTELLKGFLCLSKLIKLEGLIKTSDLIITGEGRLDKQTLMGKAVFEISKIASSYKKKCVVICGDFDKSINWKGYGFSNILKIVPDGTSIKESIENPANYIVKAINQNCKLFK
jgi:glycerate kinase